MRKAGLLASLFVAGALMVGCGGTQEASPAVPTAEEFTKLMPGDADCKVQDNLADSAGFTMVACFWDSAAGQGSAQLYRLEPGADPSGAKKWFTMQFLSNGGYCGNMPEDADSIEGGTPMILGDGWYAGTREQTTWNAIVDTLRGTPTPPSYLCDREPNPFG